MNIQTATISSIPQSVRTVGDMAGKVMLELMEKAGIEAKGTVAMEFSNVNPALQPRMDNFKAYS